MMCNSEHIIEDYEDPFPTLFPNTFTFTTGASNPFKDVSCDCVCIKCCVWLWVSMTVCDASLCTVESRQVCDVCFSPKIVNRRVKVRGRKLETAALRGQVSRLNTYTHKGGSAWGHSLGQMCINRCNTHLDIWSTYPPPHTHTPRGVGRWSKMDLSLQCSCLPGS